LGYCGSGHLPNGLTRPITIQINLVHCATAPIHPGENSLVAIKSYNTSLVAIKMSKLPISHENEKFSSLTAISVKTLTDCVADILGPQFRLLSPFHNHEHIPRPQRSSIPGNRAATRCFNAHRPTCHATGVRRALAGSPRTCRALSPPRPVGCGRQSSARRGAVVGA
jgi:hypothetical protein